MNKHNDTWLVVRDTNQHTLSAAKAIDKAPQKRYLCSGIPTDPKVCSDFWEQFYNDLLQK